MPDLISALAAAIGRARETVCTCGHGAHDHGARGDRMCLHAPVDDDQAMCPCMAYEKRGDDA